LVGRMAPQFPAIDLSFTFFDYLATRHG
jgi:hypothetical protein